EPEERRALGAVLDSVEVEQVGDVAFLEADAAQLEAADLGVRRPDRVAGGFAADPVRLAEATQLGADDDAQDRRAVAAARIQRLRFVARRRSSCDHGSPSGRWTAGAGSTDTSAGFAAA